MAIVQGVFPTPVPAGGKQEKRIEGEHKNHNRLFIGILIAILAMAAVGYAVTHIPAAPAQQQNTQTQNTEQTTYTETAVTSQNNANSAGQETFGTTEKVIQTDKWYSLGNNVVDKREITLKDYSTIVLVTVEAKGLIIAELMDTKLREQGKVLEVKVKITNNGNDKILETLPSTIGQGGRTNVILGDWRELMNDKTSKIDSRTIKWQPEFKVKNLPNQQGPTKDSI